MKCSKSIFLCHYSWLSFILRVTRAWVHNFDFDSTTSKNAPFYRQPKWISVIVVGVSCPRFQLLWDVTAEVWTPRVEWCVVVGWCVVLRWCTVVGWWWWCTAEVLLAWWWWLWWWFSCPSSGKEETRPTMARPSARRYFIVITSKTWEKWWVWVFLDRIWFWSSSTWTYLLI